MASLRVGLTGALASGKSTIARQLARAGFKVVDADRLVADLYRAGEPGARVVAELIGPAGLRDDGAVDKVAVARRIFSDPALLRRLESGIHPLVRHRFAQIAAATEDVAVLEATLLVEAGYAPDFDLVVTVEAPEEVRLRRAVRRGLEPDEARSRMAAQGDGAARRAAAHVVMENDGDLRRLRRATDELIAALRQRAAERKAPS
jgi:dephospho-CoA kinase